MSPTSSNTNDSRKQDTIKVHIKRMKINICETELPCICLNFFACVDRAIFHYVVETKVDNILVSILKCSVFIWRDLFEGYLYDHTGGCFQTDSLL